MVSLHSIMSSIQDISRIPSVWIHHIREWKKETIVIILMCWRHQWMIQNEELILFLSSNVIIRFKVYHSNCLSEEETKKNHFDSLLNAKMWLWFGYADSSFPPQNKSNMSLSISPKQFGRFIYFHIFYLIESIDRYMVK